MSAISFSSAIRESALALCEIEFRILVDQENPASPPQADQATLPGDGKPSSPELKPSAFLSTSCLLKNEYILKIVSALSA